ncbi:MAG: hypothetical protein KC478_10770 [Bacteriovoracaceae bacterium]|nr:hypothetical protein [Bacteriovoracaceae bacterium]
MIEKLAKHITQYYQISLVSIMIAALGSVLYFWHLGFIDGSRSKSLHKAGFTWEKLQTGGDIKEINNLILKENPKKALEKLSLLEKDMKELDALVDSDAFDKAQEELGRLKTSAANLISFQKSSKVLSVFNDKIESFHNYAKENRWRTLTRMSERVSNATDGNLVGAKLSKVVRRIDKDFNSMVKITENSILSDLDKTSIKERIASMQVETSMLKKHVSERDFSLKLSTSFQKMFEQWLGEISPDLSYQKLQVEQMGRYYAMGMLALLGLSSLLFFVGFAVNRWALKKSQKNLEEEVKALVADSVIAREEIKEELYSKDFQEFVGRTSDYVNKRMSFGTIFQDALPFSSIMLDKNLKVEWTNRQFCSDWEITEEEAGKDYMSWDYLSKLTNLGHDDPVLEALKNNVAGIYQIQLKANSTSETKPYEMFVSPVKYNNSKKIMLFFYPLLSMRETIKDQAVSIVNPIDKTLRLFMDDTFDTADKEQLRKEYEIGGIENMLDMFEEFAKKHSVEKRSLNNQITALRTFLEKTQSVSEEIYQINSEVFSTSKDGVECLKSFKEGVSSLSDSAKSLERICSDFNIHFKSAVIQLEHAQSDFSTLKNSVEDMAVSIPNLDTLKDAIKSNRTDAAQAKDRLGQALTSFIHIKKGISHPEIVKKFQAAYDKLYGYFDTMSAHYTGLEKRLVQLEVGLSKTQMIINSARKQTETLKSAQDPQSLKVVKQQGESLGEAGVQADKVVKESEALIVESLQSLYKGYKENLNRQAIIAKQLELADSNNFKEISDLAANSETTM